MKEQFRLIKKEELQSTPWKNVLGLTTQIYICPEDSDFLAGDFEWRLSSAQVSAANQFSKFPGYQRILAIAAGDGLILNGEKMGSEKVHHFSGDESIDCKLIGSSVVDLGIIYRADQYRAEIEHLNYHFEQPYESLKLSVTSGQHFFFLAKGRCELMRAQEMLVGDVLQVLGPMDFRLQPRASLLHLIRASVQKAGS